MVKIRRGQGGIIYNFQDLHGRVNDPGKLLLLLSLA